MIQSNAKSLWDNTAMLYKQTASSRHYVCLDQRSFKCKIGGNCSNIFFIQGQNSNLKFPSFLMEEYFYCYPARCVSIMFGKQCFTKFLAVKYSYLACKVRYCIISIKM